MRYVASPTGTAFLASRSFLKLILGPVGGGKSTVCLFDLLSRAMTQAPFNGVRRTKFVILRNTMQQLMTTVKPALDMWFVTLANNTMGQWRLTDKVFEMRLSLPDGTSVFSEFCLMAADTPDDVRRLLSLEASAAWVEEAREVNEEVFQGLQGRVARFPSRAAGGVTYPGVICSTNPPPMGTFWQDLIANPPANVKVFCQPAALLDDGSINPEAENLENLDPEYYANLVVGKTQDWIDVYLKNKFGPGGFGQPIFRASFKRDFHVSKEELKAIPSAANPLVVGMDNGLQAAAVVLQQDARSRVNVLSECYVPFDQTMGVESFLDKMLVPHLTAAYPTTRRENFLFVLDPACFHRSQVNEATIAQAVQARGFRVVRASTNDPEKRQAAVEGLLTRAIDAGPGLLLSSRCAHLAAGLDFGYRYRKNTANPGSLLIEKNHFSHTCFPAGTYVATPTGAAPIEKLGVGDLVATPLGPRRVSAVMSRETRELVELTFSDGRFVQCTPEHPFWTQRGFVPADMLEYSDVLLDVKENSCHALSTQFRNFKGLGTTGSPPGTTKQITQSTEACTCTGPCGSTPTGRYRLEATCTTSTATGPTIGLKTCACSARTNTSRLTAKRSTGTAARGDSLKSPWLPLLSGTVQKLRRMFTGLRGLSRGSTVTVFGSRAPTVARRSSASVALPNGGSAPTPAKAPHASNPVSTTSPAHAPCAAKGSCPTSTSPRKPALKLAGKKRLPERSVRVHDLEIEEAHAFYANGVLVSNCEALEYACLHFNAQFSQTFTAFQTKARTIKQRGYAYV